MTELINQLGSEQKFANLNVILVGLPGSGKSSLIDSMLIKPNYLSLGEITRNEVAKRRPMATSIEEKFATDDPWPPEFVVGIVAPYILTAKEQGTGFVLDGIPRKSNEARTLVRWIKENGLNIDLVLHLHIDPKIALRRIATRSNAGRLETAAHYESRMRIYLKEEAEILRIMQLESMQNLTINTNDNPHGFAKQVLLSFVSDHFKGL